MTNFVFDLSVESGDIEDAINATFAKTRYGIDGGAVSFKRPVKIALLRGGWHEDYQEVAFLVCGSGNKARGFVTKSFAVHYYGNYMEYMYVINMETVNRDELVKGYVTRNGTLLELIDLNTQETIYVCDKMDLLDA